MTAQRLRCDGCPFCRYIAPGGQAWNTAPHVRCSHFDADVPIQVGAGGAYLSTDIPPGCPQYAQARLFDNHRDPVKP